jgi:hypothetical protein
MPEEKASEDIVQHLLARKNRVTRQELRELVKLAQSHEAEFVGVSSFGGDEPDDWCGTVVVRGPRPPKLGSLIEGLVQARWVVEVFPYGIPVIDRFRIDVRNQAGGRR